MPGRKNGDALPPDSVFPRIDVMRLVCMQQQYDVAGVGSRLECDVPWGGGGGGEGYLMESDLGVEA